MTAPRPTAARALLLAPFLLAGCVGAPAPVPPPPPSAAAADATASPGLAGLRFPGAAPATTRAVLVDGAPASVSLLAVPDTVFFDFDEAEPRADAAPALDALARLVEAEPSPLVLTVAGNTDAVGSTSYNQALSLERADRVVAALEARGVSPGRLHAVGFGRTRPVATNGTVEGRARNRRVELALSPSFAANAAALAATVPPVADVPNAAVLPDAPAAAAPSAPAAPSLARRPAPVAIHANTPERIRPHTLGPTQSY